LPDRSTICSTLTGETKTSGVCFSWGRSLTHQLDRLSSAKGTFSGKIIVVDLPVQEYRLAGRLAALA
jgi:hypothetical protein